MNKTFIKLCAVMLCYLFATAHAEEVKLDGATVEPCFTAYFPFDSCVKKAIDFIDSAVKDDAILLATYHLTSTDVITALLRASERGVYVFIVLDMIDSHNRRQIERLVRKNNIEVRLYKNNNNPNWSRMHHKFIVVAYDKVGVGAWNFKLEDAGSGADDFSFFRHAPSYDGLQPVEKKKGGFLISPFS